ncbi:MAG: DUF4339 domain-containing protein [Planctomycetia bacterium]|nr:DUF4339 domain-containing protein [Planctomycetia bacterium]
MGIRFYCPNGHKLNVKSFLAGQRGICPKCGAKMDIPFQSTREKGSKDLPIAAEWEERARREGLYPFNNTTITSAGKDGNINLNDIHTETSSPQNTAQNDPASWNIFPSDGGNPAPSANISDAPFFGNPMDQKSSASTPPFPNPFSPKLPDPFADAPDAIWYVRISSGDQFGPVKAPIIRQWLTEQRIAADTLLWREGWSEWKTGDKVFDSLALPPAGNTSN